MIFLCLPLGLYNEISILPTNSSAINYIQEQAYNSILTHRHQSDGDKVYTTFSLSIDKQDVNKQISILLTFFGWNKQNLNATYDSNPLLTIQQINPYNTIEKTYSIDFGLNSKLFSFYPSTTGVYKLKVLFTQDFYSFINLDSGDGDISVNCRIRIDGLSGPAWVTTTRQNISGAITKNHTIMRDLGNDVLFWLNFNISGQYYLTLNQFIPDPSYKLINSITLTNGVNSSIQIVLPLDQSNGNDKSYFIPVQEGQTGLWKIEYTENSQYKFDNYELSIQDPNNIFTKFFLPLNDNSAPNVTIATNPTTDLNLENVTTISLDSNSVPVSSLGIVFAFAILILKKVRI